MTLLLPDDFADEVERAAKRHGISRSRYLALIVAYWLGRGDERDEIAAIHERLNDLDGRIDRNR